MPFGYRFEYEIRKIDAWRDGDGWTWNDSYKIGTLKSAAWGLHKPFRDKLLRMGIKFKNRVEVTFDGNVYELIDSRTQEPLFAMIPVQQKYTDAE